MPKFVLRITEHELNSLIRAVFEQKRRERVTTIRPEFSSLLSAESKLCTLAVAYANARNDEHEDWESDLELPGDQGEVEAGDPKEVGEAATVIRALSCERSVDDRGSLHDVVWRNLAARPEMQLFHRNCGGRIVKSAEPSRIAMVADFWECFQCGVQGIPNLDFEDRDVFSRPYQLGETDMWVVDMLIVATMEEVNAALVQSGLYPIDLDDQPEEEFSIDDEDVKEDKPRKPKLQ